MKNSIIFLASAACSSFGTTHAFTMMPTTTMSNRPLTQLNTSADSANAEVERLRQQAAKIRQELAELQGKSVEEVEEEARNKKDMQVSREKEMRATLAAKPKTSNRKMTNTMLYVPETIEEQTNQAALAIERAFVDGITRQTVRLALVQEGSPIAPSEEENGWPGGQKQMYREAGRPLTEALLKEVRAPAMSIQTEEEKKSGKEAFPPEVNAQDIWDFDGSALVTSQAAVGPSGDVQAMVFPNTDVKYLKDIGKINESFGKERLFLLVNPFWRNVESWGFNILAPNAKKLAQEKIFDCEGGGFQDTYVFSRFSARGEDCVSLKAYPYDWEMFAFIEDYSFGRPMQTAVRLGSSKEEPTSKMFSELLNERPEFKMNKTMRQLNNKF